MLLRQTILYLPAQVVGPAFQLISVVAWTHFLSPDNLGVYALVSATQELAYIASLFWFTLYTMRYHDAAAPAEVRRRFLNTESAVMLSTVFVSAAVVAGLAIIVEAKWTPSLLLASLAFILTRAVATQLTDRARTEHDTITYSALQMIWPVAGLAIGVAFVMVLEPSAALVLWGYAIAQMIALVIALVRLEIGWRPLSASTEIIKAGLRYGVPLLAGGIFIWVASNSLRFVIEAFEGAAAVGLITVGWALGMRAANFAAMLVTAAAFPLAVKRAREYGIAEGQEQLVRNGVLLLIAVMPAVVGLWAIATPFVQLAVAAPYREMTMQVLPLALAVGAIRAIRIHFGEQVFLLRERPLVPLINDVVDAGLSVIGSVIGLWYGGLHGSVVGATIGALVGLCLTLASAWYWYRFTLPALEVLKVALATSAMVVAVGRLPLAASASSLATAIVVGAIVYGIAIAMLNPAAAYRAAAEVSRLLRSRSVRAPS